MFKKRISYADHAWLSGDNPNNLMVITVLMTFDAPLDYHALQTPGTGSAIPIQTLPPTPGTFEFPFRRPYWEDDPCFDVEAHIERVTLPPPGDQTALQDLISQLMSTELDNTRPLWKFYLVENSAAAALFRPPASQYRRWHCFDTGAAFNDRTSPRRVSCGSISNLSSKWRSNRCEWTPTRQRARRYVRNLQPWLKRWMPEIFWKKGFGRCFIPLTLWIALARGSISLRQLGRWHCGRLTQRRYSKVHLEKRNAPPGLSHSIFKASKPSALRLTARSTIF